MKNFHAQTNLHNREGCGSQKGIALLLVLWVLVLLSVIVGEFCHTTRTEVNITRNFKESTQAYYIARTGLNIALNALVQNKLYPAPVKDNGIPWRVNADIPPIPFGDGAFVIRLDNESGKININRAGDPLLRMMLGPFDLSEEDVNIIVDSIQDWRDKDDLHRLNGAENEYYQKLDQPYNARNGDFDSPGELLLVRGMTPEIFNGIKDIITIYPRSKKADIEGNNAPVPGPHISYNTINLNAASPRMLRCLPLMTRELAQAVMDYRKTEDFISLSQLIPIVGDQVYAAIIPYLSLQESLFYTLGSVGTLPDNPVRHGVEALVEIDLKRTEKYRIIQWMDDMDF